MAVGFQWLVSGGGAGKWTFFSAAFSLLASFTFVVAISYISFLADKKDFDFIPGGYLPSNSEVCVCVCHVCVLCGNTFALTDR